MTQLTESPITETPEPLETPVTPPTIKIPSQTGLSGDGTRMVANLTLPSADKVKAGLVAAGADPSQVHDILWLHGHAKEKALRSNQEIANLLSYEDGSVISKVFNGRYTALETFCKAVRRYRQTLPLVYGDDPFVKELSVVRDLCFLFDMTRDSHTIAMVCGPNQSGKTEAAAYYAKVKNHGQTPFVRMPVGGGTTMFLYALCRVLGISERNSYDRMKERVLKHLDPSMLLIVDEAHQALIGANGITVKTTTIETIREIHDVVKCGVVLIGTDVLPKRIQDDRFKDLLGQTDNRGVLRRRVPPEPTRKDIRLLCEAYGLEKPEGDAATIVKDIAKTNGIGKLCKYFQMSRTLARNSKQLLSWQHFLATHATLQAWAEGKRSEKEEGAE